MGLEVLWLANVPLTKWSMLQKLTKIVSVSLRRDDRAVRFNDKEAIVLTIKLDLVDRSSGDNHIITISKSQVAVHRTKCPFSLVHENNLVSICILKEVIIRTLSWSAQYDRAVIIDQHRL